MAEVDGGRKRRVFRWSSEARGLAKAYQERIGKPQNGGQPDRKTLVAKLVEISGNPRDACSRFLRHQGVVERRSYREWTKAEQQRLLDLIVSMPVAEAARVMRRTQRSIRSMLHRLEVCGRQGREWFTKSALAAALHIRPDEVQRWIDRGWLKCRVIETQGVKMPIIDPDDFCDFFKQHGRQVVGRRLSYEGIWFVRNYVFPPSHAELLPLRGSYKKRASHAVSVSTAESGCVAEEDGEEDALDQQA